MRPFSSGRSYSQICAPEQLWLFSWESYHLLSKQTSSTSLSLLQDHFQSLSLEPEQLISLSFRPEQLRSLSFGPDYTLSLSMEPAHSIKLSWGPVHFLNFLWMETLNGTAAITNSSSVKSNHWAWDQKIAKPIAQFEIREIWIIQSGAWAFSWMLF